MGVSTTNYTLVVAMGLPQVIHTSDGHAYLHLPGVMVADRSIIKTGVAV